MCLRDQGIDDKYDGIGSVRRDRKLRNNDRGVGRGQVIRDASKGSETTTEATGACLRNHGIYDNCGGVSRRKISTKSTTTTMNSSAEDRRRVQGIKDDDGGRSESTTGLVDFQRQQSVDFP